MRVVQRVLQAWVMALCLAFSAVAPAVADFETGQRAWDAGRPAEALAAWQSAAEEGDGRAMLELGRAYVKGLGAPQDFVEAHKWLNLAAGLGSAEAAAERDALAQEMTVEERAEARKLARAWRNRKQPAPAVASSGEAPKARLAEADRAAPPKRALQEAQSLLGALGYDPGPADGIWGRRSAEAYRRFLRDAGLESSDTLTPAALRVMRRLAGDGKPPPAKVAKAKPPADLHRLVQAGDVNGLKAALAGGSGNIDARDGRGWTALMHAANKGYALLVPLLLKAGSKIDLRAPDGATALFISAVHGHSEVIGPLMKAGADISIKGPRGKTAVDLARAAYGAPEDLDGKNLDPAIAALVRGRSWAEFVAAKKAAEELRRKFPPGKAFRDCIALRSAEECPEMVVVASGSFTMGSPASEEERYDAEGPQHRVTISQSFAVGKYEVTREEFARFVEATGRSLGDSCWTFENGGWKERSGRGWRSPGYRQTGRDPVVCVNWDDARAYMSWLSRRTGKQSGKQYRLLTEAEWEYAARAGTTGPFHFGSTISTDQANYNGNFTYGSGRKGVYREKTVPVGSFPPNSFGLYDMHGNVFEWVEDCWHDSYSGSPSDGSAWTDGGDCTIRVLRGGSWSFKPRGLRSANRYWNFTGNRSYVTGFRIARTLF